MSYDPNELTPFELAFVEAWNAEYPEQAVPVTCLGFGKLRHKAFFEDSWRARWMIIIKQLAEKGIKE